MEKEEKINKAKEVILEFFRVSLIHVVVSIMTSSVGTRFVVVIIMPETPLISALFIGIVVWAVLFFASLWIIHQYDKIKKKRESYQYTTYIEQKDKEKEDVIKGVINALNDFATSLEALLEKRPQNTKNFSEEEVMPILIKLLDVGTVIRSKPEALANRHLYDAFGLFYVMKLIKKRLESPKSIDSNVRYVRKEEIDALAKRARKYVVELGEKTKHSHEPDPQEELLRIEKERRKEEMEDREERKKRRKYGE